MSESEVVVLRREVRRLHTLLDEARAEIQEWKARYAELEKRFARLEGEIRVHDHPNTPSSKSISYHKKRKKSRERRGEDVHGSPGDRAPASRDVESGARDAGKDDDDTSASSKTGGSTTGGDATVAAGMGVAVGDNDNDKKTKKANRSSHRPSGRIASQQGHATTVAVCT